MTSTVTLARLPDVQPGTRRLARRVPLDVVLVVSVGLVAAVYPVVVPGGSMTAYGYDGSMYLGASIRLVHGVLPYRDFIFGQPPGITLLMAPVSAMTLLLGTNAGLWISRALTIGVVAANCGLVAMLLRRFGIAASLSGGLYLALFSESVTGDTQLKLEPYVVLFTLLAAMLLFKGRGIAGPRRALWAGVLIGFEGLIKLWAIFPAVVMVVLIVIFRRTSLSRFVVGTLVAFSVGAIPFLLAAPSEFVRDTIIFQFLPTRQQDTTGAGGLTKYVIHADFKWLVDRFPMSWGTATVWIGAVVLVTVVVAIWLRLRSMTALEWFGVGALTLVTVSIVHAPRFSVYYVYFEAAFLALVLGPTVAYLLDRVRGATGVHRLALDSVVVGGATACLLTASLLAGWTQAGVTRAWVASLPDPGSVGFVSALVPSGSCVVADDAWLMLTADRFNPSAVGCPAILDTSGAWGDVDPSHPPPTTTRPPAIVHEWFLMFSAADYVVLDPWTDAFIPWTPQLDAWFNLNYRLLGKGAGVSVYRNEFVSPL
jgi:alpha-1,2-mannosyltransferase